MRAFAQSLKSDHHNILVFFSPSGVRSLESMISSCIEHRSECKDEELKQLSQSVFDRLCASSVVSIGPTTSEALRNMPSFELGSSLKLTPVAQCASPTPGALLEVIKSLNS